MNCRWESVRRQAVTQLLAPTSRRRSQNQDEVYYDATIYFLLGIRTLENAAWLAIMHSTGGTRSEIVNWSGFNHETDARSDDRLEER